MELHKTMCQRFDYSPNNTPTYLWATLQKNSLQ